MRSNDDHLYTATVHQTPKSWWGGKPQAPSHKQTPRRKESPKSRTSVQNPWVLPNLDVLR